MTSDPTPNPFEGMPFFGDLAKMLRSDGPVSWDVARQTAIGVATGGESEPNVDPLARARFEELFRVAELHVSQTTGLSASHTGRPLRVTALTRSGWAARTLDEYKPLLERLAATLARRPGEGDGGEAETDPASQMLGGLLEMIGPLMLGVQVGLMVGHLASRTFGQYDLPLPRPSGDELVVVPTNVDGFAEEWSLPADDLRLWICLHEIAHHTVLTRPAVRDRITALVDEFVGSFSAEPHGLEERLGELDPTDPSSFQRVLGDPAVLLGAIESDAQRALRPRLEAVVCAVVGYVDWVLDEIGPRLIASYGMLTEALRRRRVLATEADRFTERLLGLELGQDQYVKGEAFVAGIVERADADALRRLWHSERELPTPAELGAPGLWLARIDLPET